MNITTKDFLLKNSLEIKAFFDADRIIKDSNETFENRVRARDYLVAMGVSNEWLNKIIEMED